MKSVKKEEKKSILNTIQGASNSIWGLAECRCRPLQPINNAKVKNTQTQIWFARNAYGKVPGGALNTSPRGKVDCLLSEESRECNKVKLRR